MSTQQYYDFQNLLIVILFNYYFFCNFDLYIYFLKFIEELSLKDKKNV